MLTIEELVEEPYLSIVCYPQGSRAEFGKRIKELRKLDVTALEFAGTKQVLNVPVLGKGCVGLVVLAHRKDEKVALKIRRVDADRPTMLGEAELLKKANAIGVGPELLGVSRNFLLMQFVDGVLLPDWLERKKAQAKVRRMLREILEQCWRLDENGLDHGELSHAPKHVIVDKKGKPVIVDFETSSLNRKPSNVTSACQFLFVGSETAKKMAQILGEIDKEAIIQALRRYKKSRMHENFTGVLAACGL
jgi:putative serine/threonine protein kinase